MTASHFGKLCGSLIFSDKSIKTSEKIILPDKKSLIPKEIEVAREFHLHFQSINIIPGITEMD